jgi:hypothetical protein
VRVIGARLADLRMVPLAAAGWGAAWVGTWGAPAGLAAAAAGVTLALMVAALRRSARVLSIALVMAMVVGMGAIDVYRLRHGPVALLATDEAMVSVDLEIRADPQRVADRGVTAAAAAVTKAATVRVEGRGHAWLVLRYLLSSVVPRSVSGSRSQSAAVSQWTVVSNHQTEARMWRRCCGSVAHRS